jgi:hypothetical protein
MKSEISYEFTQIARALEDLITNRTGFSKLLDLLTENIKKEQDFMSQITDWAVGQRADLSAISATLDAIVTGIAALDKLITDFQNSPGVLSPSDQAALDAVQSASKALVTKSAGIVVTPPAPPTA